MKIQPQFGHVGEGAWTEQAFVRELEKTQRQYEAILAEKGLNRDILFGLGRVCQHALYHYARILALRGALETGWGPAKPLVFERAFDFLTDALIDPAPAQVRYG